MTILNQFCCCCTLRTGTIVVSTLGILNALSYLTLLTLGDEKTKERYNIHKIPPGYLLSAGITGLICYGLLLTGAIKRMKVLFWPAMIYISLSIAASAIIFLVITVSVFSSQEPAWGVLILAVGCTSIGLGLYLLLGIVSYYQQLREQEQSGTQKQYNA